MSKFNHMFKFEQRNQEIMLNRCGSRFLMFTKYNNISFRTIIIPRIMLHKIKPLQLYETLIFKAAH